MAEARCTLLKVEEIRRELELLPELGLDERPTTTRAAVLALTGEIRSLTKRGYSLARITEILSARGLHLSPETLRGYLRKPRKGTKRLADSTPKSAALGDITLVSDRGSNGAPRSNLGGTVAAGIPIPARGISGVPPRHSSPVPRSCPPVPGGPFVGAPKINAGGNVPGTTHVPGTRPRELVTKTPGVGIGATVAAPPSAHQVTSSRPRE